MATQEQQWRSCDERICLYNGTKGRAADMDRCVKHGAILTYAHDLQGLTRGEARKKLNSWRVQS